MHVIIGQNIMKHNNKEIYTIKIHIIPSHLSEYLEILIELAPIGNETRSKMSSWT